jgi:hypothetical protein
MRGGRHIRWGGTLLLAGLAAAGCATADMATLVRTPTASRPAPAQTVTQPTTAAELNVPLDPDGQPYDAPTYGATASTRPYATLHIADGRLRVLDGNTLEIFPDAEEAVGVTFPGQDELRVDIVWEKYPQHGSDVLGVLVHPPHSPAVAHWGRYRDAYGTDGGVGGITSAAVVARATSLGIHRWPEPKVDYDQRISLLDLDGRPGNDSMIFANGSGDGGYPMSEGRDADGRLVALLIWDPRYPWRLAVPEGTPPSDVVEREHQIADCIAGRRPVQVYEAKKFCT